MPPVIEHARDLPQDVDLVVVALSTAEVGDDDLEQAGLPASALAAQGFAGKADQQVFVPGADEAPDRLVVGPGRPCGARRPGRPPRGGPGGPGGGPRRRGGPAGARRARARPPGGERVVLARAVAEGARLGAYRYRGFRADPGPEGPDRVVVVGRGGARVASAVEEGVRIGEAQCLARDLVNTPGGTLTPAALAQAAVEVAERENLKVTVLGPDEIAERGLGGVLGVNRGSQQEPRVRGAGLRAREAPRHPRPGRQGHHLRLRGPVHQDRRGHDDDEDGHGRGRRGDRRLLRPVRGAAPVPGPRLPADDRQHERRRRHPPG